MLKKIILVAAALLVGYLLVVGVPKMIGKEKAEERRRNVELEERAQRNATGITGGRAGFGGVYSERAMDNSAKALNRSAEESEQNEDAGDQPEEPAE